MVMGNLGNGAEGDRRKPDWILVGASKAGTSAFSAVASKHPDVGVMMVDPPIYEPHFFSGNASFHSNFDKGKIWYEQYMAALNRSFVGEKTPDYMCDPVVAKRIHDLYPNTTIIMFLREPVSQAYSHFNMDRARGWQNRTNPEYLDPDNVEAFEPCRYLNRGLYMDHIERFLQYFPRTQLKVFIYERLEWRRMHYGIQREFDKVFQAIGMTKEQSRRTLNLNPRAIDFRNPYRVDFKSSGLKKWRCKVYSDVFRDANKRLFEWLGTNLASWRMPECD
jgi:hypothetical protein